MIVAVVLIVISGISPIGITAIASDSMHPTFSKGAGVITLKIEEEDLKEGDIISFAYDNKIVVHRIIKIEDNGLITTKGDANDDPDSPITVDKIKGEVIKDYPKIGLMVRTIKSPAGCIILLITAISLLIISFLAEEEEKKEEANEEN